MIKRYSKEEKDAVVDFVMDDIRWKFSTCDDICWQFIITDDFYMKQSLKQQILDMDTSSLLYSKEVVDFDGNKNLNDNFVKNIREAVEAKDKLIVFSNLLKYQEWYIEHHPENRLPNPILYGVFNFYRDTFFSEHRARLVFLFSQSESRRFVKSALDFYSFGDEKDLDYLLESKDYIIRK